MAFRLVPRDGGSTHVLHGTRPHPLVDYREGPLGAAYEGLKQCCPIEGTRCESPNRTFGWFRNQMKDKVPAVGGRCDGQPDMLVARKELKGPTSNFIRFTELTQALLLISAIFFIDLYWPVQSVTVP